MVSDNQLDQFFQFIKNMQLEEVISEPLIHSAYLLAFHSEFGQSDAAL